MKNKFKKLDKNIIIILVCVTIMMSQLFISYMVYGHDSFVHLFRIANMASNLKSGNIFAKIGHNYINGFGYGTGIFYPQINILLPAIIYNFNNDVIVALKIQIYINCLLSGLLMYQYLKYKIKNNYCALIGTILYVLSPYLFVQSMIRGATGESAVFVSLPLIFHGIDRIFDQKRYGNLLVIIGAIYVLQSHLISSIFIVLFSVLYLILNYKKVLNKKVLLNIFLCIIIILLASLYYLIPLLEHYRIGQYNIINNIGSDPTKKVLSLYQLIFNTGKYNIGIILSFLLIPFIYIYPKLGIEKNNTKICLILALISIIMITCPILWGKVRYLDIIQFPWRLLSFSIFFLSILAAYTFSAITIKNEKAMLIITLLIILSMSQLRPYMNKVNLREPGFDLEKTVKKQVIDKKNKELHTSLGSNDYLPVECDIDYIASRGDRIIALKGNLKDVKKYKFSNGKISADVKTDGNTKIELPLIYYLGYNIKLGSKQIEYTKSKNGFVEIKLNNASGKLKVKYTGTKIDIIANFISILTFLSVTLYYLWYCILNYKNIKKSS